MTQHYSIMDSRMDKRHQQIVPHIWRSRKCAYCGERIHNCAYIRFIDGKVYHRLCTPAGRVMKQWMHEARERRKTIEKAQYQKRG